MNNETLPKNQLILNILKEWEELSDRSRFEPVIKKQFSEWDHSHKKYCLVFNTEDRTEYCLYRFGEGIYKGYVNGKISIPSTRTNFDRSIFDGLVMVDRACREAKELKPSPPVAPTTPILKFKQGQLIEKLPDAVLAKCPGYLGAWRVKHVLSDPKEVGYALCRDESYDSPYALMLTLKESDFLIKAEPEPVPRDSKDEQLMEGLVKRWVCHPDYEKPDWLVQHMEEHPGSVQLQEDCQVGACHVYALIVGAKGPQACLYCDIIYYNVEQKAIWCGPNT